jgi:hypothetical protein
MRPIRLAFLAILLSCPLSALGATAADYYKAGLGLYQQGKVDLALRYCDAAVKLDPNLWQAHQARGHCLYRLGRKEEALVSYEQALALHPENPALRKFADSLIAAGVAPPAGAQPAAATPAATPIVPVELQAADRAENQPVAKKGVWSYLCLSAGPHAGLWALPAVNPLGAGGFGSYEVETDFILRAHYGVATLFRLAPCFDAQTGFFYLSKGTKYKTFLSLTNDMGGGVTTVHEERRDETIQMDYLELPVLLRVSATQHRHFSAFLGPTFSLLMSDKSEGNWSITDTTNPGGVVDLSTGFITDKSAKAPRKMDVGFKFGVGGRIGPVMVDAWYDLGLKASSSLDNSRNKAFGTTFSIILLNK